MAMQSLAKQSHATMKITAAFAKMATGNVMASHLRHAQMAHGLAMQNAVHLNTEQLPAMMATADLSATAITSKKAISVFLRLRIVQQTMRFAVS